jgi:hypothetical protein
MTIPEGEYFLVNHLYDPDDEGSYQGFTIITRKYLLEFIKDLEEAKKPLRIHPPRVQGYCAEFETTEDYLKTLTIKPISEEEYNTLGRLFPYGEYGDFRNPLE